MKRTIYGMVLLLFLCPSLKAESWKTEDKVLLGTYLVGEVLDGLQTQEVLRNPKYREINPLVKTDRDIIIVGVVDTVILIWIANHFERSRTKILIGMNIVKWSIVGRAFSIGIRF